MRALIAAAITHRGVVAALALVMVVYGAYLSARGRLDVLPDFVPPQVTVQTEAPGLAPEQIETLVTRPLENALSGIASTSRITSESIAGLSVVNVVFEDTTNIYVARQGVAERLAEVASRMPPGVAAPRMSPMTSATMDLLKIGLVSDQVTPRALRDIADWELRPRLLAVPGVARITVYGGEQRQYQVEVDPARLAAANITLTEVIAAARASSGMRGAGQVDLEAQRVPITTAITADPLSTLGQAVIATRGDSTLLLRDVARVSDGAAIAFGDAVIQGRPGVLLSLSSQYGANTLDATRAVEAELKDAIPALRARGITVYPALHRPATFIETALGNLRNALALGAVLIVVVLVAFLRDWRSALISFLAIPLSLFAAVAVLEHFGIALNTLTLGGFAVALGVLVDDAVIYLENILRRLRENARAETPRQRLAVIRDASLEISASVVFATGVILLVFLPVFMLTGVQGKFMTPLALAFSLSVLASLAVALTVTPALAALLLRVREQHAESRWLAALRRFHRRALEASIRHRGRVLVALAVAFVAALAVLPLLSGEFMPSFREGHFVAQVATRVPGTSLKEMTLLGRQISADLLRLPFVATVSQQVGRAEQGEDTWGPERSEFHIELKPDPALDQDEAQSQIRAVMATYPAVDSEVLTFLGDRVSESLSGETAQGVVQVFGADLDAIERTVAALTRRIAAVDGIADVQAGHTGTAANLSINLLPEKLAQYGLQAGDVLEAIQTEFAGTVVNQVFEKDRAVDVVVVLPSAAREHLDALRAVSLRSAGGPFVTLDSVAQIYLATGRAAIRHEAGQRFGAVTYNASGRGIDAVATDVRTQAGLIKLPAGTWLAYGGEAQAQQAAQRDLVIYSLAALSLIVMLLSAAFERRRLSAFVMLNLPFSLMGAVLALALSRQSLSLGALVGLVTVFGISARNAILLLTHLEHLIAHEPGSGFRDALIIKAAEERLLPVVMTALVTALGLVPLALGVGKAGNEIEAPLAIAVLGGLATSTLLCLVVLPAMVVWTTRSRFARWLAPAEAIQS